MLKSEINTIQKMFECPRCYVTSNDFIINDGEEERIKDETNYNQKVEEFKKIIEEHNNSLKDEYYEEYKNEYFLGIFPHITKVKKLKCKPTWFLDTKYYNSTIRKLTESYIYESSSSWVTIPLSTEYIVKKYELYKYIECKTCGYKHYI